MLKNLLERTENKLNKFYQFAVDVIYDKKTGFNVLILAIFLKCLSIVFKTIVKCRYFLYSKRIFQDTKLGCQVIIVGNLTVGGTGKTPVTEMIARNLRDEGRKVAILTRGYKSKKEGAFKKFIRWITSAPASPPKIVSNAKEVLLNSEIAGDEPFMLASNLKGVVVLVDKNRVKSGLFAIKEFECDTLILDDGFQYLPLKGHHQILLIDKNNPFGNKNLLPRGILREPLKHLKRASVVLLTKSDGIRDIQLEQTIKKYNKTAEIIECKHAPKELRSLDNSEVYPLEYLENKNVLALSGIAVPESFEKFLEDYGANLIIKKRYLDHHRFSETELKNTIKQAKNKNCQMIVTTEKDAVRIPDGLDFPIYYIRLEIEILSGEENYKKTLRRICLSKTHDMKATRPDFLLKKQSNIIK